MPYWPEILVLLMQRAKSWTSCCARGAKATLECVKGVREMM